MEKRESLNRTCSACGQQKPLNAFLEISGAQGTTYVSICSTCRGAGIKENKNASTREEEHSSSTTGKRIRAEEKVVIDKKQQETFHALEEAHAKHIKERENKTTEKLEKNQQIEKSEKDHRQNYLQQKRDFLNYQTKKLPLSQTILQTQNKAQATKDATSRTQYQVIEEKKLEDAIKHELKNTTIDFSLPFTDPKFGEARFRSLAFQQFKAWLGAGKLPMLDTLEKLYLQNAKAQTELMNKRRPFVTEKTPTGEKEPNPAADYTEKTFGGPAKRR